MRIVAVQNGTDPPQELDVVWAFDHDKHAGGSGWWQGWSEESGEGSKEVGDGIIHSWVSWLAESRRTRFAQRARQEDGHGQRS